MKKFYISLFFLTFFATAGQAAVYKWVDEEGNLLRYSDVPQKPGDQPMDMPKPALEYDSKTPAAIPEFKPSTISAPEKKPEESQPVTAYSAVTIMNIGDDEGVRANGGVFDIKLASQPALEYDSKTPAAIPEFKPSTTSAPEKKPEESQPVTAYSAVTIMNIRDDEGVRANGGVFDIKLASQPALDADAGHRYAVLIDGAVHQKSDSAEFQLQNLERGTHTISAQVLDRDGSVLTSSSPITMHVLRR